MVRFAAVLVSATLVCVVEAEDIPALFRAVQPSVVTILALDESGAPVGQGSGFITNGSVVTCRHVLTGASQAAESRRHPCARGGRAAA